MKISPYAPFRLLPKSFLAFLLSHCLFCGVAMAASSVTVTVDTSTVGRAIPTNFVGLSFGMKAVLPDKTGAHFFSPTNNALINLFREVGIHHLRVGGTSVESPVDLPIPGPAEIDDLFAFTKAAGVGKVIYTLRLLETNDTCHYADTNAVLAKYIWDHYRDSLDSFALGNEPNHKKVYAQEYAITNFDTYLAKWKRFVAAITNVVPEARFSGPDGTSSEITWTTNFANALKDSGLISAVTEHFYVGGAGRDKEPQKAIAQMLSTNWISANERIYKAVTVPVIADGLTFHFTEGNDHYSGGAIDASDTFAGALWALDFLHWWARHATTGVDFHNTQWVVNDVLTVDANHRLMANPKAYGLKAFNLGAQGRVENLTIKKSSKLNLTAYAVRGEKEHYITLINKDSSKAKVTISIPEQMTGARLMSLVSKSGKASAKQGIQLGSDMIDVNHPWRGQWTPVSAGKRNSLSLKVAPFSAIIVAISTR